MTKSIMFVVAAAVALTSCVDRVDDQRGADDRSENRAATPTNAIDPGNTQSSDQRFIQSAMSAGMKEIEVSQVAVQKTSDSDVKDFAQRMIRDHRDANEKLANVAGKLDANFAPQIDERQDARAALVALSGEAFDGAYISMMVNDHQRVVAAVGEKSNDESAAAEVRQWAANTLPMLRDHLSRAHEIQSQLESQSSRR